MITYGTIPREQYTKDEIKKLYPKTDKDGNRYTTESLSAPGSVLNGETGKDWKGISPPKGRHWCTNQTTLNNWNEQGLIEWSKTGNPRKIVYAKDRIKKGKAMQDIIDYKDPQRPYYPTTKNKELLKKIILASTNEKSVVLDCFCGSGTLLETAQKLNRKFIGMDNSPCSQMLLTGKFKKTRIIKTY